MDLSKLNRLRQVEIKTPCGEDWDAMAGDDQQRFCAGCGCFVHNLAGLPASEAEELLAKPERVCTRMTLDAKKGILTRDGWIPRLLLAGAIAASAAGCSETTTGDVSVPPSTVNDPKPVMGDTISPNFVMGKMANPPEPTVEPKRVKSSTKKNPR